MGRKVDALYDVAEALGFDGDKGNYTIDALNDINDTLGYEGGRKRYIAEALEAMATVATGGGGGGGDLGALTFIVMLDAEPVVDSALSASSNVFSHIMVGDSAAAVSNDGFGNIAGGVKAYAWLYAEDESANTTVAAWAITLEESAHDYVCKSRRALTADCDVVYGDPLSQGESATWAYLVIPDPSTLADGEMFAFSIVNSKN